MPKMKQLVIMSALLALIALNAPGRVEAGRFNQFIGFGDSTLDSGYFRYNATGNAAFDQQIAAAIAGGAHGGFAGNGVMGSIILAGKFGLSAAPVGGGGTDYGNGYARTVSGGPYPGNVPTVQEIANYLSSVNGVANPHALYVVQTGNNDQIWLNNNGGPAAHPDYLRQQASALAAAVATLQKAGARTIIVPNSFFSAVFAGLGGDITSANAAAYATNVKYGADQWSSLKAAGVHFIPADLDSVFRYVVHNPSRFGFTASSVLSANAPSSVIALLSILTPAQQRDYLFIDGGHLTTAGQTIEADYEYSLLTAPSQISLLAENAVQDGLARADTIQAQIDLSGQHRGPSGVNAWVSAGANSLRFKDNRTGFPNDSGIPFGGTLGVDYRLKCGVIVGVAFSGGSQSQGFSTGGSFDQVVEAPSLYAAYKTGPAWANAVATYGAFQDKIRRQVPLGIFTDENNANATGHALALALRGGGDFKLGQITTGPVGGLVLQQVCVDGFTETGTSGVTALSFDGQTRGSVVTQLGWRVLADVGRWQPFVETKWNHEWAGKDRTVTAALTTVAAPAYSMDAFPVPSDWGTALVGSSYKLSSQVTLLGRFSFVFLNQQVSSFGGELGLNVSF
jgi:outer membrane lipase/esterase